MSLKNPSLHHPEDYGDENNLEHQENAKQQFMIMYNNCKDMLGINISNFEMSENNTFSVFDLSYKTQRLFDIPEILLPSLIESFTRAVKNGNLQFMSMLQSKLIGLHLLVNEGHDFDQYKDDINTIYKVIKQRGESEDVPAIFSNSKLALETGGIEPPHKDMIHAKKYFADTILGKLKPKLERTGTKVTIGTYSTNYDIHVKDGELEVIKLLGNGENLIDKPINTNGGIQDILAIAGFRRRRIFIEDILNMYVK